LVVLKTILKDQGTVIRKKRLEIHWSMLNAHCARRKATLYFSPAIAAKVEFLVTAIVTFPNYRSTFKRSALLS